MKSVSRFEPGFEMRKGAFGSRVRNPQPGGQLRELSGVGFHSYPTPFPFLEKKRRKKKWIVSKKKKKRKKKKRELKSVSRFEPRYWKYAFVSNVRDPQPGGQLRELSGVGFHSYSTLFPFLVVFHSHRNPNGVTSPRWRRGFVRLCWDSGDMREFSGFSLSLRLRTMRERRESCWGRREKKRRKINSNGHFHSFLVLLFLLTFFGP